MTTTNIAEVLKLAAKPVQYDNDEKTWLEFRFKLENYLTLVDEMRGTPAERRVSTCGEPSHGNGRISGDRPNVESHTVRLSGDTDHGTKLETGAKECQTEMGSMRGDRWRPRTRRKRRVGDSRCCKLCYSRE